MEMKEEEKQPLLIQVSAASLLSCLGEDQSPKTWGQWQWILCCIQHPPHLVCFSFDFQLHFKDNTFIVLTAESDSSSS